MATHPSGNKVCLRSSYRNVLRGFLLILYGEAAFFSLTLLIVYDFYVMGWEAGAEGHFYRMGTYLNKVINLEILRKTYGFRVHAFVESRP